MWFPEMQRCHLKVWNYIICSLKFFKKIRLKMYLLQILSTYLFLQPMLAEHLPCAHTADKADTSPQPRWAVSDWWNHVTMKYVSKASNVWHAGKSSGERSRNGDQDWQGGMGATWGGVVLWGVVWLNNFGGALPLNMPLLLFSLLVRIVLESNSELPLKSF